MLPTAELALRQMTEVRAYTLERLEGLNDDDWYRQPTDFVTHIAWQVGHLAMAQYYLALMRIRGEKPDDAKLISPEFIAIFAKGSTPSADRSIYPTPAVIRHVFDMVHHQACQELPTMPDHVWGEMVHKPHRLFNTKLDSLLWCGRHEMLHAGQIGLIRRLLGMQWQW